MNLITLIFVALLVIIISVLLITGKGTRKRLPGPIGLPIVGYIPFLTKKSYIKLTELSKKYGPLYSIRLGSLDLVVITNYDIMKEAFSKDAFMGKSKNAPIQFSEETLRTEAFTGLPWKEQKRFSIHMFNNLGFGKTRMEEHIKEEILELLEIMSEHVGKPKSLSVFLIPSMSNIIASVLFGKRLKYNDPERQKLDSLLREFAKLAGTLSAQTFFPWLKPLMSYIYSKNYSRIIEVLEEIKDYCRKEIKHHEATLDPNNIRDFLDGYLLEVQKKIGDPNTTFKKGVLEDLSRGFFAAGSETVRVTVDWMLCICAAYSEVQKRIQAEIDEVVGRDRFPTWQDRLRMPYTEASIAELMRWRTIVPLNMRYTLENTELNGYFIPKERFLSPDGQKVVKPEYAIPFSVGKRSCPGKSLAEIEVFLYIVAILQKFEVSAPPNKEIDLEGELGISLQPKRQELCLKTRHIY
ncbi:cytochrome P450 2A9 [Trichonephila clavata]|uniref:Cytochrome P450 2A9 n=1 Tax=Trichonephila clavata TaxID=2740835 RepID=A0A8X6J4M8_TRICU|nr:cytochrome P450 2A9 [Trichonephila clavata]